jgi:hypothetical protein
LYEDVIFKFEPNQFGRVFFLRRYPRKTLIKWAVLMWMMVFSLSSVAIASAQNKDVIKSKFNQIKNSTNDTILQSDDIQAAKQKLNNLR